MIGKPSSPARREAARKRTSPRWHLAVRPTHPRCCTGSAGYAFLGNREDIHEALLNSAAS
jgi:hypothetical protein